MHAQHIKILDTTLRDGQQCPGAGMSFEQNIEYAKLAQRVGVDILEAGFPAASQTDFNIVKTIAQEFSTSTHSPIIAALCQCREAQIYTTIEALSPTIQHKKSRLHVYFPVDPILMDASLGQNKKSRPAMIEDIYRLINIAVAAGVEVQFTPEGYARMGDNFDFVTDLIRAVIQAGATIINCPDTIGGACILQAQEYFVVKMQQHADIVRKEFPQRDITWSAHCHNDFGLALINTMNAVFDGPATQIEGCFNGIGERAGNAALEQCIMYIKHFGDKATNGKTFFTHANTEFIATISNFVHQHMLPRQPHWPITGENAARHSSGGHTNAVIKNPLTYQPFDPKEVGQDISLLFGPLSGSNHVKNVLKKYGHTCTDQEKVSITQFIKNYYAERRKGITDDELLHAFFHYHQTKQS